MISIITFQSGKNPDYLGNTPINVIPWVNRPGLCNSDRMYYRDGYDDYGNQSDLVQSRWDNLYLHPGGKNKSRIAYE